MVAMPKIPRIEKFCFCMDVVPGVKYFSAGLVILWILYLIAAAIGGATGNAAWGVIWSILNILSYLLVVLTIMRGMNRNFLLPAMGLSLFDILAGIANAIFNIVTFNIFGLVMLIIIIIITIYYFLGLKTIFDDMGAGAAPPAGTAEPAEIKFPA